MFNIISVSLMLDKSVLLYNKMLNFMWYCPCFGNVILNTRKNIICNLFSFINWNGNIIFILLCRRFSLVHDYKRRVVSCIYSQISTDGYHVHLLWEGVRRCVSVMGEILTTSFLMNEFWPRDWRVPLLYLSFLSQQQSAHCLRQFP